MPESIFSTGRDVAIESDAALVAARELLIRGVSGLPHALPRTASSVWVWPSAYCPVGCGHCNYASPRPTRRLDRRTVIEDPAGLLAFISEMEPTQIVLSGGGEPMTEEDFCRYVIARADAPELKEIKLVTSGHFATSEAAARASINGLVDAWRARDESVSRIKLTLRVSLDWFHAERIGVEPAANIIRAMQRPELRDVGLAIRSIELDDDTTLSRLAAETGGLLRRSEDGWVLELDGGRPVKIRSGSLIFDGRMSRRKLERLPVRPPERPSTGSLAERVRAGGGHYVPAMAYETASGRMLEGLLCVVEDNGNVKILDGNAPDRTPTVFTHPTWRAARDHLYADPLSRFLVQEGPHALAELLDDAYPGSTEVGRSMNQLYYLVDPLLRTPARRLYATLRVIEALHLPVSRESVADGWSAWRVSTS